MTISLTYIALHVRYLDACVDFYQNYTDMKISRDRITQDSHVIWLAKPGKETEFIMVLMPNASARNQALSDLSYLGFAVESRNVVNEIAQRAAAEGILEWKPRQEPYPVGYYCGVRDPDGNFVEFSYGQPLRPGAIESTQ